MLAGWLLLGLALHKLVWEVLKRRHPSQAPNPGPLPVRLLKVAVLAGMVAQIFLPNPFPILSQPAPLRAIGLVLFTSGVLLAVSARITLGANWSDIESGAVGRTQQVVRQGLYGYVRHPIYAADLLLVTGFELSLNSWLVLGVVPLAWYVRRKAISEEQALAAALPGYAQYARETGRFLPF